MKVFLLEDDPVYRYMIGSDLREMGHEVITWDQINGASDAIREGNFDLLIIDIILPEDRNKPGDENLDGGIQVLESLKEQANNIPVTIFVSVYGYETNKARIDKLNTAVQPTKTGARRINIYFQKPYNKNEFRKTIEEIEEILTKKRRMQPNGQ